MRIVITIIYIVASTLLVFSVYHGYTLWIVVALIPFIFLVWQIFFSGDHLPASDKRTESEFEKLKATGQKINIEFDNCEFKDSSYSDEVIDERMVRFNSINLDYGKVIRTDFVGQSMLVYYHPTADKTERFTQAFPCSAEALKVYVLQNAISLYVDPFNKSHYFFDLKVD